MSARPFIDSLDFARNGREIGGKAPVAELPRLQDVLESPRGILSYTVRGGVDNQGSYFLDVSVTGQCQLRCQRCLEGMDHRVQLDTRLLLRDQASLDAMGDVEEEFDSIVADGHMDVLDLLEEEILLSLPIAPRHESGTCQTAGDANRHVEERHPYCGLGEIET